MDNKINILLIDDNPGFCSVRIDDAILDGCISDNEYTDEQRVKKIPVIRDDALIGEREKWNQYFSLMWLQSPLDVREFCDLSSEIENRLTPIKLGEKGFIPEIICFDYVLSDYMNESYYNNTEDKIILSTVNPNYTLIEIFASELEEKKELYRHKENASRNYMTDTRDSDNMGCYAGGITAFMFRNHPCSSIPVTFKTKDAVEGKDAGYFEWLLHNEFDEVFDWEDRGTEKAWHKIIPVATRNLRNRIENQVQSRKIFPEYYELLRLSSGEIGKNDNDIFFTFTSIYGKKRLPLNGLFIEFDQEARKEEISIWAQKLLEIIYNQKEYSLSTISLNNAFALSNELWTKYGDVELVLKRLRISELGYLASLPNNKLAKEIRVQENETQYIDTIKLEFQREFDILTNEFGIKNNKLEYGFDLRSGNYNFIERRWGTLITMLRLHHHFLKYSKNPDQKVSKYLNANIEPQEDDYYLALFPLATTPLVTRLHKKDDGDNFKNALKRQTSFVGDSTKGSYGLQLDSILNCKSDENSLLPSEKYLLNSIIKNENEFPLYSDILNIPSWLK